MDVLQIGWRQPCMLQWSLHTVDVVIPIPSVSVMQHSMPQMHLAVKALIALLITAHDAPTTGLSDWNVWQTFALLSVQTQAVVSDEMDQISPTDQSLYNAVLPESSSAPPCSEWNVTCNPHTCRPRQPSGNSKGWHQHNMMALSNSAACQVTSNCYNQLVVARQHVLCTMRC